MRENLDVHFVLDSLSRLQTAMPDIFGANGHGFRLNSPLAEAELSAFERVHGVSLPGEYRHFLINIGNGGAGPYYGVFPLGSMDAAVGGGLQPWYEGFVGDLDRPFPHRKAWNDLEGMPEEGRSSASEEEYIRKMDAFDEKYWDSKNVNGAIPICHKGCALRVWLVMTGDEAGKLWDDNRADYRGLHPTTLETGERATFARWYNEWLVKAIEALS